jgi:hypothetical protein
MAEETDSEGVLGGIAHALLKLGDSMSADRIFGLAHTPSAQKRRSHASPEDRDRAIITRLTSAWGA